jgi:hypothetical protein
MKARLNMKVANRNALKETRDTISFVTGFVMTVTSPATLTAGVILISASHSELVASLVFVSIFAATLVGFFCWLKRRPVPKEALQLTVHAFVSHVRMHPELLKGRTEFDLERFRKQWEGSSQMTLGAWIRQFSGELRPTSQFR